jgi:hypothetical protein
VISRRAFLLGAGAVGLLGVAGAGYRARDDFQVERLALPLTGWSGAPLNIVFLADLHCGPYVPRDYLLRVAEAVKTLRPDLLLFGGDYVYVSRKYFDEALEPFDSLEPPLGKWGVLGNHDHYQGRRAALEALRRHRVEPLENASAKLWWNRNPLWLFGVDDLRTGRPDPAKAAKGLEGEPFVVGMTHNPDLFLEPSFRARPPLLLAGHTHGGQVRLPLVGAPFLLSGHGRAFASGRLTLGPSLVHVSRGVGTIALPMRLFCPPEVTVVRLGT